MKHIRYSPACHKFRIVQRSLALALLITVAADSRYAQAAELKKSQDPASIIKVLIEQDRLGGWVIVSKIDVDGDGDLDELVAPEAFSSRGTVGWILFFREDGEYFYAEAAGGFSSRLDMLSFGPLEENNGHPAFVTYTKRSASTGVTSAIWFEKSSEGEVEKHEKVLRQVDVSYGSETAEADKALNERLFSKLGPIEFSEYKWYSRQEAIDAFKIQLDKAHPDGVDTLAAKNGDKDEVTENKQPSKTVEKEHSVDDQSFESTVEDNKVSQSNNSVVVGIGLVIVSLSGIGFAVVRRRRKRRDRDDF